MIILSFPVHSSFVIYIYIYIARILQPHPVRVFVFRDMIKRYRRMSACTVTVTVECPPAL